jgi:EAL domain-containing protein (putative c-di-GMP-specific phosphodiesterase class I)
MVPGGADGRRDMTTSTFALTGQAPPEAAAGMGDAIRTGAIRPWFQPIVCISRGEVVGYEALARWHREDGTVMPAAAFLPTAEAAGLVDALGMTILDQACAFLQRRRGEAMGHELMVGVNVSATQLDDRRLVDRVDSVLARYAIPRSAVCLEVTESALVPGDLTAVARLHVLKRLGISLALDDFGSTHASLSYLTQAPIDLLKLGPVFLADLRDDPRRMVIARSVIAMARELGIAVLAEGIETAEDRDLLSALGCELAQGYLWSPPVPAEEARSLPCVGALAGFVGDTPCPRRCAAALIHLGARTRGFCP